MSRKKVYYYGTSADHLEKILKYGIQPVPTSERLWQDSMYTRVYMWCESRCKEHDCMDAFDLAMESGAVAVPLAKDKRIVIFKVETAMQDIWDDTSGQGMEGAVEACGIPAKYITEYTISEDLSLLSLVFMRNTILNEQSRLLIDPTPLQEYVMRHIKVSEFDYMLLSELPIQWTTVKINCK